MATIEKQVGKTGTTYRITVYSGFDTQGKRIRHRQTYKPEQGMTPRQIEKAVQRAAADFERSIEQGYALDNRQTFAEYADYVLAMKERTGVRTVTLDRYRGLLVRINAAIGHIKLTDLRPQHLNAFYKNLAEPGLRANGGSAVAKIDIAKWLKQNKLSRASIAEKADISAATVGVAVKGKPIQESKAAAIAQAMGKPVADVFTITYDDNPLSNKTVLEHHRLISTILTQAEKEMLVPYNAATKATPPKAEKHDPNYFQPEQITAILSALEQEPLKWQLITHLMIVTGCRRGEIMGLQWEKVDFEHNRVKIDKTLTITKSKGVVFGNTKTSDVRFLPLPPAPAATETGTAAVTACQRGQVDKYRLCVHSGQWSTYAPGCNHRLAFRIFYPPQSTPYQPPRLPPHRCLRPPGKWNGYCYRVQAVGTRIREHYRELLFPHH